MPWSTFLTKKRAGALLLHIADCLENSDVDSAAGLVSQGLRWLLLEVEALADPDLAWRVTFLGDPATVVRPVCAAGGLDLGGGLQDPTQITAVVGLAKDMEILQQGQGDEAGAGAQGSSRGSGGKGRGGARAKATGRPYLAQDLAPGL